ncbi:MAG: hypothetical protein GF383_12175 [Candidatus Lokiarchaeota archaeon]|nr:hypothetical protein [Candidatus Lokiarchaeota archaeon]MBD3341742.1 hypothetical protein [Candidatus Lokiarchaeota archaeon]
MGTIGILKAVNPLIKILLNDNDHETRVAAIQSLSELGDQKALEPLINEPSTSFLSVYYKFHSGLPIRKIINAVPLSHFLFSIIL